jgi:hypothetical protein
MAKEWKKAYQNPGGGAVYGLGFIGALVYFIQHAATFWEGVLGILSDGLAALVFTACSIS